MQLQKAFLYDCFSSNDLNTHELINSSRKDEDNDNSDKDNNYNMKYNGDIKLCNETPKRGGLSLSKVKKIAERNYNIDIQNKNKKELCSLIEAKLEKKSKPAQKLISEKSRNNNEDNQEELDDEDEEDEEDDIEEEEEKE